MTEKNSHVQQYLWKLALANSAIWAIAIIALIFVLQHSPGARGLFTIMAGGTAVATALTSALYKLKNE